MAAIFAALERLKQTGEGTTIDFSQFEAGVTFIAPDILNFVANGKLQDKAGNASPYAAPHNAYRCKGDDRWCVIAVFGDEEWRSFCEVIGNPPWVNDPRFLDFTRRKENEPELDRLVEEWTISHSPEEVMERMQSAGIAAGIIANGQDFYEDPQLKYRHHFWTLPHAEVGEFSCEGPSAILSETPAEITMPAPCLGEHTEFVCREFLNMPDDEFIDLYKEGVLA
jgi:benzylsuccinate CoA-transferase BbsF subunit